MKKLILVLAFLTSASFAHAETAVDRVGGSNLKSSQFKVGVMAGQVGLLGDVGDKAGGAIGLGVLGAYSLTQEFNLELDYLQSSHDDLDHKEYAFGVNNYFESYDQLFFSWAAGIAFANNELDIKTEKLKDTAFGLYGGVGLDLITKSRVSFGLQGRYYKMFDAKKTAKTGVEYKIVENFYTVLFRVMVSF